LEGLLPILGYLPSGKPANGIGVNPRFPKVDQSSDRGNCTSRRVHIAGTCNVNAEPLEIVRFLQRDPRWTLTQIDSYVHS
jgi:hypothetical protein